MKFVYKSHTMCHVTMSDIGTDILFTGWENTY